MDGAALDFEDEHFDAVLCAFALAAIPDAAGALAEMRRVLRPTGTIGVAVWDELVDDGWVWEGGLMGEFAARPARAARDGGEADGPLRRRATPARGLADAGFQEIQIDREYVDRRYPSAEAWWEWFMVRRRAGVRRVAPGGGAARSSATRERRAWSPRASTRARGASSALLATAKL